MPTLSLRALAPRTRILALSVALAATVAGGYFVLSPRPEPVQAQQRPGGAPPQIAAVVRTLPAQVGTISNVFNYPGTVQPVQQVNVVPRSSGYIQELFVDIGSSVKKGDKIAMLDQGALPAQLLQAQANLVAARARLNQVQAGAKEEDVLAATAAVEQARARLGGLQEGRTEDVQAATAALQQARARLAGLQRGRDEDVRSAQAAYDAAIARLEVMEQGGREESIAVAQAALDSARARLALLRKGATSDTRQSAISQLETDNATLASEEAALEALSLTSASDIKGAEAALAASQNTYDAALAQRTSARAQVDQMLKPIEAQIQDARSRVASATADLESARSSRVTVGAGASPGSACNANTNNAETCAAAIKAADELVAARQRALTAARANLDLLLAGGSPDRLASLRAAFEVADANLKTAATNLERDRVRLEAVKNGTAETQRAAAQARVISAQERVKSSQARVDQLARGPQDEEVAQAEKAVEQADLQLQIATMPSTEQDVRVQQNAVEQARQAIAKAVRPGSDADIQAQTQAVAQAEAALAKALRPGSDADIEGQLQAIAQAEATLASRSNPYTEVDLQNAQAQVALAEAQVAVAQANLDQTVVVAPFEGVVVQKLLVPGAFASAQTPIVTVMSPSVEVRVTVEEVRMPLVRTGQPVKLALTAYPEQAFEARVTTIAPTADARARTFEVRILPEALDERLRPGMFANVLLTAAEKNDAVLVPREAVLQQDGTSSVFVVDNNRAALKKVTLGMSDDKNWEIVSGISAGDPVVVFGQNTLRDGAAVTVPGQGGPPGKPGGQGKPQSGQSQAGEGQTGGQGRPQGQTQRGGGAQPAAPSKP